MTEKQNYLLTGIQVGSVTKPYLLTSRGIEVVEEEEVIPISSFCKLSKYSLLNSSALT
jgi:hypothetical protein